MRTEMLGDAVAWKYAGINKKGRGDLSRGAVREFLGFGKDLQNRYNTSLRFDKASDNLLRERAIDPLVALADRSGIGVFLGGKNFPLHATLLEGESNTVLAKVDSEQYQESIHLQKVINNLEGVKIEFKYLLIDGTNVLLTAIDIPEGILDARQVVTQFYQDNKLQPRPIDNILHITIGRITTLPLQDRENSIARYIAGVRDLRRQISHDPLTLTVSRVYAGTAYDLVTASSG